MNLKNVLLSLCCCIFVIKASVAQQIQDTILIDGSTGVRPLVVALAAAFQKEYPGIHIVIGEGMSTKKRIVALKNEEIDIAMASHGLDIPAFTQQGLQVHWFAQMAILLGVHPSVNIDNISREQVCNIYSQGYTNWQQLGGNDLSIKTLSRPSDEVDMEVLLEHLPCLENIENREWVELHQKSGPLAKALQETEGAIGMTTAVRIAQSKGKIKALTYEGVSAKASKVYKGKYPFSRRAYLITRGTNSPAIKRFLMFIKSRTGKKVLQQNAAVPSR